MSGGEQMSEWEKLVDRDAFRREYHGPTALYRVLELRRLANPIFLCRTLKYISASREGVRKKKRPLLSSVLRSWKERTQNSVNSVSSGERQLSLDGLQLFELPCSDATLRASLHDVSSGKDQSQVEEVVLKLTPHSCNTKEGLRINFATLMRSGTQSLVKHTLLLQIFDGESEDPMLWARLHLCRAAHGPPVVSLVEEGEYTLLLKDGAACFKKEANALKPCVRFKLAWSGDSPEGEAATLPEKAPSSPGGVVTYRRDTAWMEQDWLYQPPFYYEFVYTGVRGVAANQIEVRRDFQCPLCLMDCSAFPGLYSHLWACHERFHFHFYVGQQGRLVVSVQAVQNTYKADGRKCFFFRKLSKPASPRSSSPFSVFMRANNVPYTASQDTALLRAQEAAAGEEMWKTPYYHCVGYTPVHPEELAYDSEAAIDDEWRRDEDWKMLDEFEDVAKHEKQFMQLWNAHVHKHRPRTDSTVPATCKSFAADYRGQLHRLHLRRNFVLHLTNMWDRSLITGQHITECLHVVDDGAEEA